MMKRKTRGSAHDIGRAALACATALALVAALVPMSALAQEAEATEADAQLSALSTEEDGAATELEEAEQALEEAAATLESIESSEEYATACEAAEEGSYGLFVWLGEAGEAAVEVMDEALASGDEVPSYTELGQDGDATSLANLLSAAEGQLYIDELREADGYVASEVRVSLVAKAQIHCNFNDGGNYYHCAYYSAAECIAWADTTTIGVHAWYAERECLVDGETYESYSDYEAVAAGHYYVMMHYGAQGLATTGTTTNLYAYIGSQQETLSEEAMAETMSTSEYYERVCAYLDEIGYDTIEAHEEAQEAYEEALAAYEEAREEALTATFSIVAPEDGGEDDDAGDAADASDEENPAAGENSEPTVTVKAKQTLKVVKAATRTVKASKLKKGARTVKVIKKVTGAKGALSYSKVSVKRNGKKASKKVARKVAVNAKTGKVTLKKGLAKGTYKVQVRVKAAATSEYKAASKVVTVKVKVK